MSVRLSPDNQVLLRLYAQSMMAGEELPRINFGDLPDLYKQKGFQEVVVEVLSRHVKLYSGGGRMVVQVSSDLFEQPLAPPSLHLAIIKLDQDQDVHTQELYAFGPTLDGLVKCQPADASTVEERRATRAKASEDAHAMDQAAARHNEFMHQCMKHLNDTLQATSERAIGHDQVVRLLRASGNKMSLELFIACFSAMGMDYVPHLIKALGKV